MASDHGPRVQLARAARALAEGDAEAAERLAREILAREPRHADALHFLGALAARRGDFVAAERDLRASLAIAPHVAAAHLNLAMTLHHLGQLDAAIAAGRRAVALQPDLAEAHFNLATSLLLRGDLGEGGDEYEWRWRASNFTTRSRHDGVPRWTGEPIAHRAVLLWGEQGVGDELLHAGLIAEAAARAPHCILECEPRLAPLFARSFPGIEIVPRGEPPHPRTREIEFQCPTGSLQRLFRRRREDFPPRRTYLAAAAARAERLRAGYRALGSGPAIGIAWRSKNPRLGAAKTVSLPAWAPILTVPGVTFVNLQYGDTTAERDAVARTLGIHIHHDDSIDPLADLDAFAAQVAALDLVVTIDNTTVHVAGALGKQTWLLLPSGPGLVWFWFLGRADSPWYPSLRLFRQPAPGDWTAVIARIAAELRAWGPS